MDLNVKYLPKVDFKREAGVGSGSRAQIAVAAAPHCQSVMGLSRVQAWITVLSFCLSWIAVGQAAADP